MFKKLFILCLLVILPAAIAQADTARRGSFAEGFMGAVAVSDVSSGTVAEVDSAGNLRVANKTTKTSADGAALNTGTALVSGAAYVQSITMSGFSTTAGDYVLIYDDTAATGEPDFEITVGTAKETVTIPCYGAYFSTGVFADSNSDAVFCAITYN